MTEILEITKRINSMPDIIERGIATEAFLQSFLLELSLPPDLKMIALEKTKMLVWLWQAKKAGLIK